MLPTIKGRACWIFKDANFDIDNIVGVQNITLTDIEQMKKVCMTDYDPDFANVVEEGDILIGGENFGYGHPHYVSFKALRALGIKTVIVDSFNPSFYKGEVANGMVLIEAPGISEAVERWDDLSLDWCKNEVCVNGTKIVKCIPIPQRTKDIVECGGLLNYIREKRL